ncbi:hypothetical protein SKAU_G00388500 [Synaphobranchus kaupii]|uniref:Uncharacterized protein n=1 Tax=Synaphobranchus kaupii TaxID=118154 RepID=A0A9Q1EAY4_SYNKA|nr:hypothetical protein SKAU_G00388500 [Synaphobranchus kaupii]
MIIIILIIIIIIIMTIVISTKTFYLGQVGAISLHYLRRRRRNQNKQLRSVLKDRIEKGEPGLFTALQVEIPQVEWEGRGDAVAA